MSYLTQPHATTFPPRARNLIGTPSNGEQHLLAIEQALSDSRDAVNQLLARFGTTIIQANFQIAANSGLAAVTAR